MVARTQQVYRVRTIPAQHDLVADPDGDYVVATEVDDCAACRGPRLRFNPCETVALDVHLHDTVVAQNRVDADPCRATAGKNGVTAHTAQDRVVAVAHRNLVCATRGCQGIRRLVTQRQAGAGLAQRDIGHHAVVANHDVVARDGTQVTQCDRIRAVTAQHDLGTVQRRDHVVTAQTCQGPAGRSLRLGRYLGVFEAGRVHLDVAVVAKHRIATVGEAYRVRPHAAENHVAAFARKQFVVAAGRGKNVGRLVAGHRAGGVEVHLSVIAEQDVIACSDGDVVAVEAARRRIGKCAATVSAAEYDVAAFTGVDVVVAADRDVYRSDRPDQVREAVGLVAETTPAQDLHDVAKGIRVLDPPAVAEDDVVVAAAPDVVLALAAEDHQRQRGSRCVDGVVVGPCRSGVIVVVRSLRVDGEELVGGGAERHGHGVVAEARVEGREGAHVEPADLRAGVLARAGDRHRVGAVAAPDRNAAGVGPSQAGGGGVVDGHRSEAADLILRDHDSYVGNARARITDHQAVGT